MMHADYRVVQSQKRERACCVCAEPRIVIDRRLLTHEQSSTAEKLAWRLGSLEHIP